DGIRDRNVTGVQTCALPISRRGARGFLCKSEAGSSLPEAIRAVAAGEFWFRRQIIARLLSEYPALAREARDRNRPINRLSEKERSEERRVGKEWRTGRSRDQ